MATRLTRHWKRSRPQPRDGKPSGRVSPHGGAPSRRLIYQAWGHNIQRNKTMKKQFKRATIVIFSTILLAALSAGCGTVSGFGKDVETVGDGIQQSTR